MTDASPSDFSEEMLLRIREHEVRIGDIVAEVRHFTAVSGILFGFLLTVSVAYTAQVPWIVPRVLLLLALCVLDLQRSSSSCLRYTTTCAFQ